MPSVSGRNKQHSALCITWYGYYYILVYVIRYKVVDSLGTSNVFHMLSRLIYTDIMIYSVRIDDNVSTTFVNSSVKVFVIVG